MSEQAEEAKPRGRPRRVPEYLMIQADTPKNLMKKVNAALADGFKCEGGPMLAPNNRQWYQAVSK